MPMVASIDEEGHVYVLDVQSRRDFVHRFEEDEAKEERVVVRYRLVEPFE